jgi:hypothetical protein
LMRARDPEKALRNLIAEFEPGEVKSAHPS